MRAISQTVPVKLMRKNLDAFRQLISVVTFATSLHNSHTAKLGSVKFSNNRVDRDDEREDGYDAI
jgi:hypothetical protein